MSNNYMISFPRELSDELAELIAEKARVCGGAFEIWEAICEQFGTQAKHQGEPVAYVLYKNGAIDWDQEVIVSDTGGDEQDERFKWIPVYTEQPAHYTAVDMTTAAAQGFRDGQAVPDGYCLMPTRLTAENGAKALLLGEFKLEVTSDCPECRDLEEPLEGCEVCDGEGEYGQQHMIPWDQIKFIYSEAVKGLAKKPNTPQ